VKWKLWTRNENMRPLFEAFEVFDSKDAALEKACDIIRHQRHVKVLHIEKPDGSSIEFEDIVAWWNAKGRPA
jgi:hypothetical protein